MILWMPKPAFAPDGPEIDVSLMGEPPWCRLSIDYQHGQIPVPGLSGMYSESVRGIMEGLKLIGPSGKRGKINPGYFVGPGRDRPLEDDQWLLGYSFEGSRVGLGDANRKILIPAYHWMVQNKCPDLLAKIRQMHKRAEQEGEPLLIHDNHENGNPDELAPLSGAAILVAFLNGESLEQEAVFQ